MVCVFSCMGLAISSPGREVLVQAVAAWHCLKIVTQSPALILTASSKGQMCCNEGGVVATC